MVNNTFALQSYKFFNAIGDGFFSTAVNSFVTSLEDRKLTLPLLGIGAVSKLISMVPFYSDLQVSSSQAHPISGTSYPAITGLITAQLSALVTGNTPTAKMIGKSASLIGGVCLDYFNKTIVYEFPSTLMCANAQCLAPVENFSTRCTSSDNSSYSNATNCTEDRCYVAPGSTWDANITVPEAFLSAIMLMLIHGTAYHDLRRLGDRPLNERIHFTSGQLKPLQLRVKIFAESLLWMSPVLTHLLVTKFSEGYRLLSLYMHQNIFSNIPYIYPFIVSSLLGEVDSRVFWMSGLVSFALSIMFCAPTGSIEVRN